MIYDELRQRGLVIEDSIIALFDEARLDWIWDYLERTHREVSLFSERDSERILERHLYESLIQVGCLAGRVQVSRGTRVADAGSGMGLPGILFFALREVPQLTLIDSSRRKLHLLEEALGDDSQVQFKYERLEEMTSSFDLVTSRALAPFPHTAELLCRIVELKGYCALFTGQPPLVSRRETEYLKKLGFVSRETMSHKELTFLGERTMILLQKIGPPERGYPRHWKKIKEEIKAWEKS